MRKERTTVAGGLLGLLRVQHNQPDEIDETTVDQLTEAILRMLGIPAHDAKRLTARALPNIEAW